MSFAISIIGCIFGCRISNAPNYEYQAQHHFALESRKKNGVPIVETYPSVCVSSLPANASSLQRLRIDVAKWDADKQRVKNGCTNKLKQSAAEINTDLLKYYAEIQNIFKEFEVQEVLPTTQQLKEAFNMRMKDTSEEQPEEGPCQLLGGVR